MDRRPKQRDFFSKYLHTCVNSDTQQKSEVNPELSVHRITYLFLLLFFYFRVMNCVLQSYQCFAVPVQSCILHTHGCTSWWCVFLMVLIAELILLLYFCLSALAVQSVAKKKKHICWFINHNLRLGVQSPLTISCRFKAELCFIALFLSVSHQNIYFVNWISRSGHREGGKSTDVKFLYLQ